MPQTKAAAVPSTDHFVEWAGDPSSEPSSSADEAGVAERAALEQPSKRRTPTLLPLGYQLASHRSEHIIVVFDALEAFIREFPFHGQRDEQLLAHQPQA